MSRLRHRIERLEEIKGGKRGPVCVYVDEGESVDEAKAQYLAEHPEDPEASRLMIVRYRDPTWEPDVRPFGPSASGHQKVEPDHDQRAERNADEDPECGVEHAS